MNSQEGIAMIPQTSLLGQKVLCRIQVEGQFSNPFAESHPTSRLKKKEML